MYMNRKQFAVAFLFALSLMMVALAPLSGQQAGSYNPWLDYNGDGLIDVYDLQALAQVYGTSGTPLSWPMAQEYDSGWIDISDKQGQNITITHNLNLTGGFLPSIYGRTVQNDPSWHQRHFDGTGYTPGWNKTYEGISSDGASSVVQTDDGGYALAGSTNSYGAGGSDFGLVKTDSAGTVQWNKTYGGANHDSAASMVQTGDGGYALAGATYSYGDGTPIYTNFWLVKTDGSGNAQWNKTYEGPYEDEALSVVQTSDGGYALAGYTYSYGVGTPTYSNFWLVKTDAFGLTENMVGLGIVDYTADTLTLYRGKIDPYWNYVRVRIWVVKENP